MNRVINIFRNLFRRNSSAPRMNRAGSTRLTRSGLRSLGFSGLGGGGSTGG